MEDLLTFAQQISLGGKSAQDARFLRQKRIEARLFVLNGYEAASRPAVL